MFPLCSKCCECLEQSLCQHSDEERTLTGTWVTLELHKALQMGYTLTKIHEVWHFDEIARYDPDTKEGGLFAEYVNAFLKMKQEASDWPTWCQTSEQKHQYIKQYFDREGIELDWENIKKNPGLRAIAKLMLNRLAIHIGLPLIAHRCTFVYLKGGQLFELCGHQCSSI